MNLLSHYFLEERNASPWRKLGALLPDLIPQFNRRVRRELFRHGIPAAEEHRLLFEGIQSHYAADAFFHGSAFFTHHTRLINARLRELPLPSVSYRSFFLAHVFLELMLDRLLVKQNPSVCVRIYHELHSVNPEAAASYFLLIGKPDIFPEFFDNFNRFLNARHLPLLADNEMYVKALLRAYRKIVPAYPSQKETEILMALTEETENTHRHELLSIFDAMRQPYVNG